MGKREAKASVGDGTTSASAPTGERAGGGREGGEAPRESRASGGAIVPGRVIYYFERDAIVEASRQGVAPDPIPGIIRRVRTGGEDAECDLIVFGDYGPQNLTAVPRAVTYPQAGAWCFPPRA